MADALRLAIAGEPMLLLADRALYWPARQRLLIADLHLGKGTTFRSAGIAVPSGGTAHDLARLDRLLVRTDARSLWILGDFLHAARHPSTVAAWQAFRSAHPNLAMAVVPGNHDRALAGMTDIDILPDMILDGPFLFRHAPMKALSASHAPGEAHLICGHVHPVVALPALGTTPVFWLNQDQTVLPAFSAFTGGWRLPPDQLRYSVACNGNALVPLSQARHGAG